MKPAEDILDRLTQAWATGQGTKVAACFSTAGRFIAFDGSSHVGRDQIASFHQMAFDGPLRGTRLEMAIADCRELPGDLILISTRGGVRKSESTDLDRAGESIQSLLAKQGHQGYEIELLHNARYRPIRNAAEASLWSEFDAAFVRVTTESPAPRIS